jgi:type II secretory pathway component GspD/PulD (secretin)
MKSKLFILTLVGVVACQLAGTAQTNPNNTSDTPPADTGATNVTEEAASPAKPAPSDPAAVPAVAPDDSTAVSAGAPADAPESAPAVATVAGTNQPGNSIPLIVMDDVPLTDAIKNLARQAGLNYMLDPKIGFGQADQSGKPTPQPMVSIRWENVSAEQALATLLGNYSLQLVEDPKSKIARVTIKDPATPDPLKTEIIQLKYASPTNILASVQNTLTDKRSKVVADVRTSQLVVLATENEQLEVKKLIERLDTITKQVLIEAKLMETSMNPSTIKGLDWKNTLEAQTIKFGNHGVATPPGVPRPPIGSPGVLYDTLRGFNPATAFLDADGFSAVLSFLNQNSEAKVLSTPRTVTLDNETANISVTRSYPIFKNTAGTQGSPGGSEVTYTNLGVLLNVTPRISANNYVNLRVVPEVSRIFDTTTKVVADTVNTADIYDIRKIDTRVMIPSGNTLVLGGLVQDGIREKNSKVPILGDIPVLGYLFRRDSKEREKQNLLIFITPTIVGDQDYQPASSTYLQTPVPQKDELEGDWSYWDTGKPKDWSKKKTAAAETTEYAPLPETK